MRQANGAPPKQPGVWARLEELRRDEGWDGMSDASFAARLGQDRATYSNWKNGHNRISGEAILEVAKRTGYRAEWLWWGSPPKRTLPMDGRTGDAWARGWKDAVRRMRLVLDGIREPPDEERPPTLTGDIATREGEAREREGAGDGA